MRLYWQHGSSGYHGFPPGVSAASKLTLLSVFTSTLVSQSLLITAKPKSLLLIFTAISVSLLYTLLIKVLPVYSDRDAALETGAFPGGYHFFPNSLTLSFFCVQYAGRVIQK